MTYINVEAGVDARGGVVDVGPEVAAGGGGVGRSGEGAGGWEDEIFVEEVGVAAGVGAAVDVGCEGGIEGEEAGPVVDECYSGNCHESVIWWQNYIKDLKTDSVPEQYRCLCSGRKSRWSQHCSKSCRWCSTSHLQYKAHSIQHSSRPQ